jgi:hypothetical protein
MRAASLRSSRRSLSVFGALLLVAAVGCGSGKGTVSGQVTLDGKPLPAGKISFLGSHGQSATADITDGQYTVSNVPTGEVKVTVQTGSLKQQADNLLASSRYGSSNRRSAAATSKLPANVKEQLQAEAARNAEMAKSGKRLLAKYRPLPDKYSKPDSSGLRASVSRGDNSFDVPLTTH